MGQKIFPAVTSELDNVLAMLEGECENLGVSMGMQMQISVALEELFVNIANYAYGKAEKADDSIIPASQTDISKTCTITMGKDGDCLSIRLEDEGIPFDPFAKIDPDVTMAAEDRDIGGLGIYIVKKTMDECEYIRENGHNIVVIKKKLTK
ncbi:MAG: ATP-binding protein [Lachnospiraceae bacterium]|nr:ATP-binding protein [Lachnospiraceae bacterium]